MFEIVKLLKVRAGKRAAKWSLAGSGLVLGWLLGTTDVSAQSGVLQFSTNQYSVFESDGFATIRVARTGGTVGTITVAYATADGTAVAGVDYLTKSGTLVFAPNETSKSFSLLILDNTITNLSTTVLLSLSNPTGGAALGAVATSTLTIKDNDSNSDTVGFEMVEYSIIEDGGPAVITVERTGERTRRVTVDYLTVAGGTATPNDDYLPSSGQLIFEPGQSLASFIITILDDTILGEGTETVFLQLTNPSPPNAVLFAQTNATLRLLENDFVSSTLLFSSVNFTARENDGSAKITVARSGSTIGIVTVDYYSIAGTATAGIDYSDVNGTLTFTNGQRFADFFVPLMDDAILDMNETVFLTLTNVTSGSTISQASATLTIFDNESRFQFSTDRFVTNENTLYALVTVVREGGPIGQASVDLFTYDGGGTNNAESGFDYTGINTNLVFADAQTFTNIAIPIIDDSQVENNESFFLYLTNAVNAVLGPFNQAEVVIVDNDSDAGAFSFVSGQPVTTPEFGFPITVSVTRSGGSSGAVSVGVGQASFVFDICPGSTNARSGFDYTLSTNRLYWADGEMGTKSLSIRPVDDDEVELDEFVALQLFGAQGGAIINANDSSLEALILYDDQPPGAADRAFNLQSFLNPTPGANNLVYDVAVYTNGVHEGKTIIVGEFTSYNATLRNRIARVNPDGSVDPAFNPGAGADGFVNDVEIQDDGRILIAGGFSTVNNISRFGVARLNPDGSLDTTFNPGSGVDGMIMAMLLQNNGKVVIGGSFNYVDGVERRNLARLNSDGSLDDTFNPGQGPDSMVWTLASSTATVVNSIGAGNTGSGPAEYRTNINVGATSGTLIVDYQFLAVPDTLRVYDGTTLIFDTGLIAGSGTETIPFGPGSSTVLTIVVNEGSGAIGTIWDFNAQVVTGSINDPILVGGDFAHYNGVPRNHIARVNTDGSLDITFNPGTGTDGTVYAITTQSDASILVGGAFRTMSGALMPGLARLRPDGSLDESRFHAGTGFEGAVYDFAFQSDGKLLVAGDFTAYNGIPRTNVARLYSNGTLDTGFLDTYYNRLAGPNQFVTAIESMPLFEFSTGPGTNTNVTVTVAGEAVFIGGAFTTVGGGMTVAEVLAHTHFTRLIGGDAEPAFNLPGNVEFVSADYSVDEHGGLVAVTVRRVNGEVGNIHLHYATEDGSAVAGLNYEATSGELFWEHCSLEEQTFFVPILDDDLIEGNKIFKIVLTDPVSTGIYSLGYPALGFQTEASVLIIDNDTEQGTLGFSANSYYVNEDAGSAVISVTRTNGSSGAVSVRYSTSNGSAMAFSDYTSASGTLFFGSGDTVKTFTVPIRNDISKEFEEVVVLRLANPTGGALLRADAEEAALVITDDDNGVGSLSYGTNNFRVSEANPAITVTVQRTSGSLGQVSVNYFTVNTNGTGWAYPGVDYQPTSGTLTFLSGQTAKSFEVPIFNDLFVEGNENILLGLTNVQGGASFGFQSNAVVTIEDNDAYGRLGFAARRFYVNETAPEIVITVVRSDGDSDEVAVDYRAVAETAAEGIDFLATSGSLIFLNGETTKTFSVPIVNDDELEAYETISLLLTNFSKAVRGPHAASTLVIIDDESLSVPAGSVNTGFTAGLNGFVNAMALQEDGKLIVGGAFTLVDGIARNRIARLNANGTVDTTFKPGAGLDGPVYSMALQDNGKLLVGGDFNNHNGLERFNVDGSRDSSFQPGNGADNPVHALALLPDQRILIGGSFVTFNGISRPRIARLNSTGSLDSDFDPGSGPNERVYALAVQPDGRVLIGGAFVMVDGINRGRLARLNADGSLDSSFLASEAGANGTVYALALQPDGKILIGGAFDRVNGLERHGLARLHSDGSVDATFLEGLAGANNTVFAVELQPDGNVLVGGDFISFNGINRHRLTRLKSDGTTDPTINFGTGANSFISTIALQADNQIIVGGGFTEFDGLPRNYLARLVGGMVAGSGQVKFSRPAYEVDEPALNAAIAIRRLNGTTGNLMVEFATQPDTATDGLDFQGMTNEVLFVEGETIRTMYVPIINDTNVENDEVLRLALRNPSAPSALGEPAVATLTIKSDECLLGFTLDTFTASENTIGGMAKIYVERAFGTNTLAAVSYATIAGGTAITNEDYLPVTGTLVFAPGENLKFFTIPIINDFWLEAPETIRLALSNPTGAASLGRVNAILNLVDDDPGPGVVGFASATYSVTESEPEARISLTRTNGSSGPITVRYSVVGGTATPNADFGAPEGILTFGDGEINKHYVIPIFADTIWEGDETVLFRLSNPTGGAVLGAATNATLFIQDDETPPDYVAFADEQLVVKESDGAAVITIERPYPQLGSLSVWFTTMDGTATNGLDYEGTNGILTFVEGQKELFIRLAIKPDSNVEGNETFSLALTNVSSGAEIRAPSQVELTIQDDDILLSFSDAVFHVPENGSNAVVTILRTGVSNEAVRVDYGTLAAGTNQVGVASPYLDYIPVMTSLLFAPGENVKTFQVPILDDALVEGDESVSLFLSNAIVVNGIATVVLETNVATLIIDDDDSSPGQFAFSTNQFYVSEGRLLAEISLLRTNGSAGEVAVSFATFGGTAISGQDFTAAEGVLVFPSGVAVARTNVTILPDTNVEGLECFQFRISNPTNYSSPAEPPTIAGLTNAQVCILDDEFPPGVLDPAFDPGEGPAGLVRVVAGFSDGRVLIGGGFTNVAGTNRNHVARLNADGSLDYAFDPGLGVNAVVSALSVTPDERIVIGGAFTNINGLPARHLARLLSTGVVDPTFNRFLNFDAGINALILQSDEKVVVGGNFRVPSRGVARLHQNGNVDPSLDLGTGVDGAVLSLSVHGLGSIVVGGNFNSVNGFVRQRVARLLSNGVLDQDFRPPTITNGTVYAVAIQPDQKVVIGGDFTEVGGQSVPRIARVQMDGSLDTNFVVGAGASGTVYAIALQSNGKIIIGGEFTSVQGQTANRYARLEPNGVLDPTFTAGQGADNTVFAVAALDDGSVLIGGDFSRVNGYPRRGVARILGDVPLPSVAPGWLAETGWYMSISSRPGYHYVMNASSDLVTWTSLSTNLATGFTLELVDPAAVSQGRRFYRVSRIEP